MYIMYTLDNTIHYTYRYIIRQKEVLITLRKLDINKARGPDGILDGILRNCAPELSLVSETWKLVSETIRQTYSLYLKIVVVQTQTIIVLLQ